jgi:hypothetical protein
MIVSDAKYDQDGQAIPLVSGHSYTWNSCGYGYDEKGGNLIAVSCSEDWGFDYYTCSLPSTPTLSDPGSSLLSPATYTVSWSAVSGATSYVLQESTSSSFNGVSTYYLSGTSRSIVHTVTITTTYYYRVAAVNDCGQGDWSNVENIDIFICSSPPVTGVYAMADSYHSSMSMSKVQSRISKLIEENNIHRSYQIAEPKRTTKEGMVFEIKIIWAGYNGANGYKVYRKIDGLNYQIIAEGDATPGDDYYSYIDAEVTVGSTYSYYVTAYGSSWETCPSQPASTTPLPSCSLISPTNGATISNPTPAFSWSGNSDLWVYDETAGSTSWWPYFANMTTSSGTYNQDGQATALVPGHSYIWSSWSYGYDGSGNLISISKSEDWGFDYFAPLTPAKWTVMVYMSGDQSGGSSLDPATWLDLEEMESISSTDQVRIVAQLDPYDSCTGTYRYYVTGVDKGLSYPLYSDDIVGNLSEQDMSDPAVLADFVNWATTYFPADHYLLVLWDHGGGWKEEGVTNKGIMWDYTPSYSYMSMEDLADGLDSINEHIDIIGFDACLMQMIEVAYQIESGVIDSPDYMVASEEVEWFYGWNYDDILNHLTIDPTMSAAYLAHIIVDHFLYNSGVTTATLSVINLNNFSSIADPIFSAFQLALRNSAYQSEVATARKTAQSYYCPDFKDVFDFTEKIYNNVLDCMEEANAVINFIYDVVVYEGWVGSDVANSHGLSIYLPDTAAGYESAYWWDVLFPRATDWHRFLQTPSPPTVTTLPADNITTTSALLHGRIDDTGGEDPFNFDFYYKLKSRGPEIVVKYGAGNYHYDLTGLTPGTAYEFRFWAENSAGRTYGDYLDFTTLP